MGDARDSGVVNHLGEVPAHPNRIIAGGATRTASTGRSRSHTNVAVAGRIAAHIS